MEGMPTATTLSGLTLTYDTFGSPDDPPVLLVSGLGTQLISWDEGLCALLAGAGRFVIRFDNRDAGLSTTFGDDPVDLAAVLHAAATDDMVTARSLVPYTLSDMAQDAVELLDVLGIGRAHVVGASMGGMIAQTMAIEHPTRVATLTSIMSTTGEPQYGRSSPEAREVLLSPVPTERAAYIEDSVRALVWHSKRYADPEQVRSLAARSFDRSFYPVGTGRQLAAITASGSRAEGLRELAVPTLVIHGLDDTLIEPSGGRRTAELVPDAELLLVADMGHDRPRPLWPGLVEAIVAHTTD
jgi:pimeloyl-ACP methyl ester carboxylesterase